MKANITRMPYFLKLLVIYGISAPAVAIVNITMAYQVYGWGIANFISFALAGVIPSVLFFAGAISIVFRAKYSRACYISGWLATAYTSGLHPGVAENISWAVLIYFNTIVAFGVALYLYFGRGAKNYFT